MTLTQVSILSKQIIFFTILSVILGLGGFIGYRIWHSYYLSTLPPVEEKPDVKFGTLPYPDFPKVDVSSSNYTYSIDTPTGFLPKIGEKGFEKNLKVYFIVKTFASLLSPEKSQALANKFEIQATPKILSQTQYIFSENEKSLLIDLDSGNFSYTKQASISAILPLNDDNQLLFSFTGFLNSIGYLKDDLKNGRSKIILLKLDMDKLTETNLRSEAIGAQISLWPQDIDGKTIFTPQFDKSLINAEVITSSDKLDNYLKIDFTYYPVDITTYATYPSKTSEKAFEDLKSGKGVIILKPPKPQVSISSVTIGLYLSQNYSPYLQPVFVFEGPQFAAYVPAVISEYLSPAN